MYDRILLGDFVADFLVEDRALEFITKAHEIQHVNYLTVIRYDVGLLINFGGPKIQMKRKFREYNRPASVTLPILHVPPV